MQAAPRRRLILCVTLTVGVMFLAGRRVIGDCLASANGGGEQHLDADVVLKSISTDGAAAVLQNLYADEEKWDSVLALISAGNRKWLEIAGTLFQVSDAGAADALQFSLGDALESAPTSVLAAC